MATLDVHHGQALVIAVALVALVARYYVGRDVDITRRTLQPSEQSRVADRYTKAIEQLGSRELDIRLSGIYDLERLARDSAREHPMVMEVLATFIRESSLDPDVDEAEHGEPEPQNRRLRSDVQAAIAVIGRRIISHDLPGMRIDLTKADLTEVTLIGARSSLEQLSPRRTSSRRTSLEQPSPTQISHGQTSPMRTSSAHTSPSRISPAPTSPA